MRKSKDTQLLLEEVKTLSKILICVCVIKAATEYKPQSPDKMCLLLTHLMRFCHFWIQHSRIFSCWHLHTADLLAMRYIAGHVQGCFMKTKINFTGSQSSPCLTEQSCQIWGYTETGCSQNYRATQLSDDASCLSCLSFAFSHTVNHWNSSRQDAQKELYFSLNPWSPMANLSNSPHVLPKLPPPGITWLVWQAIVGRGTCRTPLYQDALPTWGWNNSKFTQSAKASSAGWRRRVSCFCWWRMLRPARFINSKVKHHRSKRALPMVLAMGE